MYKLNYILVAKIHYFSMINPKTSHALTNLSIIHIRDGYISILKKIKKKKTVIFQKRKGSVNENENI